MKHEVIYLSAEQLGIHPDEHAGLRALERDLAEGQIRHHSYLPRGLEPPRDHYDCDAQAFNMAWGCGSACCIAGWLDARDQLRSRMYAKGNPMRDLFHPLWAAGHSATDSMRLWDAITTAQGAAAIRNFLASGDPRWNEVLGARS